MFGTHFYGLCVELDGVLELVLLEQLVPFQLDVEGGLQIGHPEVRMMTWMMMGMISMVMLVGMKTMVTVMGLTNMVMMMGMTNMMMMMGMNNLVMMMGMTNMVMMMGMKNMMMMILTVAHLVLAEGREERSPVATVVLELSRGLVDLQVRDGKLHLGGINLLHQ